MLAYTGLRWGELRALRWSDVRETPYAQVVVSRSHDGGTKSGKAREVPLLPEALDVLEALGHTGGVGCSLCPRRRAGSAATSSRTRGDSNPGLSPWRLGRLALVPFML
jgi:hypothetical protein